MVNGNGKTEGIEKSALRHKVSHLTIFGTLYTFR